MTLPVPTSELAAPKPHIFADLDLVRILQPVMTDEREEVPAGTRGTVVAIYADGEAYEVEFAAGLATVEAALLEAA